jgi:ABC-type nitrate/sulfonate/bicarbonate transport system substrate-binding protein
MANSLTVSGRMSSTIVRDEHSLSRCKGASGDDRYVLGAELATTTSNVADIIADLESFEMSCHGTLEPEEARAVEFGIGKMFLFSVEVCRNYQLFARSATPATAQAHRNCRL